MLDSKILDRARRLIQLQFDQRRKIFQDEIAQIREKMLSGGVRSGAFLVKIHDTCTQEVAIRAKIVLENIVRAHTAVGSPPTETLAADIKEEGSHFIEKITEEVGEKMASEMHFMKREAKHLNLSSAKHVATQELNVEADLYVDSLTVESKNLDSSNIKNKELAETQPSQETATFCKKQFIRNPWKTIQNDYDINKRAFGKKINFVTDKHKKKIILRDIEQAYILADLGFSKPATILAGGVIEELLRLYLKHKKITPKSNNFYDYIKTCEQKKLLKSGISRLSDSVRHFRNIVHISKEESKKYTLSKATAKSAVASIFIIANDL